MAVKHKLPTRIKVGPTTYTVSVLPSNEMFIDGKARLGGQNYVEQKMVFDKDMPPMVFLDTVLHELAHCCAAHFGWTGHYNSPEHSEEDMATAIGTGMAMIFLDNPKLVKWINEVLKDERANRKG
jgi:hypothetical protein